MKRSDNPKYSEVALKEYLKDHLTIHVSKGYMDHEADSASIKVELKLDGEVISSDYTYLD